MIIEQIKLIAENLVDLLLELENEGILSLEQTNIIAIKLDQILLQLV
jgi:hypothetical protein